MKDLLNFDHNILQTCWKLFRFAADGLKYWWQRVFWVVVQGEKLQVLLCLSFTPQHHPASYLPPCSPCLQISPSRDLPEASLVKPAHEKTVSYGDIFPITDDINTIPRSNASLFTCSLVKSIDF